MTAPYAPFTATDSRWRPGGGSAPDLRMHGATLTAELRRWSPGESLHIDATTPEEIGAVLEGRFELVCGDERHELADGQGIVIPPGEAHSWRVLSDGGVLYRVLGPDTAGN